MINLDWIKLDWNDIHAVTVQQIRILRNKSVKIVI